MTMTVADVLAWLDGLAEDSYPEDRLYEGDADMPVRGVLFCWWANTAARRVALERGANLIVAHEAPTFTTRNSDPGCPDPDEWQVNREIRRFYQENRVAFIRSHRTLDAWGIPERFAEELGFPTPVVCEGHKGYHFTLVHDLDPLPFRALAERLKAVMDLARIRVSAGDPGRIVHRVGMGWGGVSQSSNLQYMELLRCHGVEVVIGGEVDEYAMEYYRDSGMAWIELGHYASEISGIRAAAEEMAHAFPGLGVSCFEDEERIRFL